MQRVLLSCKSIDDARFLKSYIETELPYEVFLAFQQSEIEASLKAKSIHLLVLQTGNLAKQDLAYALSLRQTGYNHPIMMITDAIGNANIDEIHEKHKIYFMERPFELKTLKGLARKLMVAKAVPQQVFRRYKTNLEATLETFITGDKFETHMFNLSKGGAYFELPKKPGVAIGDLLRLKVHLQDVERDHHIHGRVVWTTHKGHAAGGYGVGVKFMKTTDIYRNLLDKV
ncbi:MAG: PilZ domain-containing protein [Bdellovibrionales bacterium]